MKSVLPSGGFRGMEGSHVSGGLPLYADDNLDVIG